MFGPREGTYTISSKSDPRWNKEWRGVDFVITSGDAIAVEVDKMKEKLGEPPKDVYVGFFKD